MTLSVPCRQCKAVSRPDTNKRDEVYVDPLSVELCLDCTEPECRGAKGADTGGYYGPPRCAYEAAAMARRGAMDADTERRRVKMSPPDPNGVMRTWECEVG